MTFHPDKKIVFVIATLATGGAERVASLLTNGWVARGNEVAIILLGSAQAHHFPLDERIRVIELDRLRHSTSVLQSLMAAGGRVKALRAAIVAEAPDAVVSFMDTTNVLTLLATRGMDVPVIVSERTDPTQHRIPRFWTFLRRCLYPRAHRVVVQTHSVARRWANGFLPDERVRTIANPVALPDPAADAAPTVALPRRFIVSVGRLIPSKRLDLLLRAYAPLAARDGAPALVIVGDGPEKDCLLELARQLGLADKLVLAGHAASPYPYLRRAEMFVMTSEFEGYPNALIEAMAAGLPVISFDCPSGPDEIIRQGENGFLVPPGDVSGLTRTMEQVWTDDALRVRLGTSAAEIAATLSVEKILDQWEEAISAR